MDLGKKNNRPRRGEAWHGVVQSPREPALGKPSKDDRAFDKPYAVGFALTAAWIHRAAVTTTIISAYLHRCLLPNRFVYFRRESSK
jgi:hypothetical protein